VTFTAIREDSTVQFVTLLASSYREDGEWYVILLSPVYTVSQSSVCSYLSWITYTDVFTQSIKGILHYSKLKDFFYTLSTILPLSGPVF